MQKIDAIHNSDLFGSIIETGCGAAVTSELLSISGASNTLYNTFIPYSKECEHKHYGEFVRSVSLEFVLAVLEKETYLFAESARTNFILASSWQLNDGLEDKYVHGWMAVKRFDNSIKAFHFSMNRQSAMGYDRRELIQIIGEQGVNLLYSYLTTESTIELAEGMCLDMAYDVVEHGIQYINYDALICTLEACDRDYPICFDPSGPYRFEDLMRKGKEFIIMKGSFNPLHHMHKAMMTEACALYPEAVPSYLISTYRYDKPHIDIVELVEHIKNICNHDASVIVMKCIYFYDTFRMLTRWSSDHKKFYFPVGTDTLNRIYKTDHEFAIDKQKKEIPYIYMRVASYKKNCKWMHFKRDNYELVPEVKLYDDMIEYVDGFVDDGTSSTKIRTGYIHNKIDD